MFLKSDNSIKWKLLLLATVIVMAIVASGMLWFDAPVYLYLRKFDISLWRVFGRLFNGKTWLAAGAIFLISFYVKKCLQSAPKWRGDNGRFSLRVFISDGLQKIRSSYVFYIFCACLMSGVATKIIKTVIGRFRPVFFEALDLIGFRPFSFEWAFNSMPSGHTAVSFAGLVMIGLLAPKYKWLTWTLAITVAFSRVASGFHWPTDVILGAFIGMVAADFTRAIFAKINS